MGKDKITYLKEKQIQKKAKSKLEILNGLNVQNPIENKLFAFKQTKEELKQDIFKDLFD